MAVRIKFDNAHNPIQPTFVLATRNAKRISILPATNINFGTHLNSASELQFKVHKENNGTIYEHWNDIVDFRLVWSPEWDIWFEIQVEVNEQDESIKNISAISIGEAELSQINLYGIEINTEDDIARDDYIPTVLCNTDNINASLLHRILSKAPHYTVGHVDDSIKNIQRTFQFDGTSIMDALNEISEEIDCLFVIDSGSDSSGNISRKINAYDLCSICNNCGERGRFAEICSECGSNDIYSGYGDDTHVFVSVENLADNIVYKVNTESVKNCFRMVAGDDLMTAAIRSCNPNGSSYIWYLSDEVRRDMSASLKTKLTQYDQLYQNYKTSHSVSLDSSLVSQYNTLVNKYRTYDPEIPLISNPIVGHPALINTYYNALDFRIYLQSSLLPSVSTSGTTASAQAALLVQSVLSPVAVTNLSSLSDSSASNAVLALAKVIVDSRYQVKVKSGTFSGTSWTGSFTVTNFSDDTDTADSAVVSVTINDSYETFIRQKISKAMNDQFNDVDIEALFSLDITPFANELGKYSLSGLNSINSACLACMNILIEQGIADSSSTLYNTVYLPYYNKQAIIQAEIKLRESEIAIVDAVYDENNAIVEDGIITSVYKQIMEIQNALNFENYVGHSLMAELSSYRREDTYENSNYISDGLNNAELIDNAKDFIRIAEKELLKSATLQHSISASLKNLLAMKEFSSIVDYFEVGNWIRIRANDSVYRLRLIGYSIDFDSIEKLSVEFSDVQQTGSSISDIESILSKASSMSSSYDHVTRQALKGRVARDYLDNWIGRGLSLTQMKIINSTKNQNLQIDESGVLCREYMPNTDTYDAKQLKIINRGLYLTDDGWHTSRAGIGDFVYFDPSDGQDKEAYGVVADVLIGNLILSSSVGVYNRSGSIKMDANGITLISKYSTPTVVFRVQREDSQGGLTDVIYFDNTGSAHFNGTIHSNSGYFYDGDLRVTSGDKHIVINSSIGIAMGKNPVITESNGTISINSNNAKMWLDADGNAHFKGELHAATGTFEGTLSANCITSGTINASVVSVTNLSASNIVTGKLSANYIEGGTLKLGGQGNGYGTLQMLDADDSVIGTWNSSGVSITRGNIYFPLGTSSTDYVAINNGAVPFQCRVTGYNNIYAITTINNFAFDISYSNGSQANLTAYSLRLNSASSTEVAQINVIKQYGCSTQITEDGIYLHDLSDQVIAYWLNGDFVTAGSVGITGNVGIDGNFNCWGTKNRVVSTSQYSNRLLYCYETPSPMFGDIGDGVISDDGFCYIVIDPVFVQTITTSQYQVFLQKYGNGDCWVQQRTCWYFIVCGTPGMEFGWEIKAKQKDYDQVRLEQYIEQIKTDTTDYGAESARYIKQLKMEREKE